jgi:Fe-S cluster assembly protein SufD
MRTAHDASTYVAAQRDAAADLPAAGRRWLDQCRSAALAQLELTGLPDQSNEDWKYTPIRPITREAFAPAQAGSDCPRQFVVASTIPNLDSYRLVFVDGFWSPALSHLDDLPAGVTLAGLGQMLDNDPARIEPWLGSALGSEPHGFIAMNSSFVGDGAVVEINAGVVLDKPVELLFVSGCGGSGRLSLPRNLVVAHSGSQATVIERHVSLLENRSLSNSVSEVIVESDARLTHHAVQQESPRSFHVGGLFVRVGRRAEFCSTTVTLDGALVRRDALINLDDEQAQARLDGLYLAFGRSHVDNHTHVVHHAPNGVSREHYKGVLGDRARAVFHGRIVVQPGAQQTDSQQRNQNLLLSRDAEVDSKPQLEIYADNVKCTHGATVGQLDEGAIFYLRSRGLDQVQARRALTRAFAADVLERMVPTALRSYLEQQVNDRMQAVSEIER